MARSSQLRSTTLLIMAMGALLPSASAWGGSDGPGSYTDYMASRSFYKGGPKPGFHVATADPSKAWSETITLKKTDGSDGEKVQNQSVVADAPDGTPEVAKDPANGINSADGSPGYSYDDSTQQYYIKEGQANAGYPTTPLANTVTNALRAPGYTEGLPLTTSGSNTELVGYNKLSETAKDYMLIYCGAGWCGKCDKFSPQLAAYYEAVQKDGGKSFDVLFLSLDEPRIDSKTGEETATAEQEFKDFYKKMPFKAPQAFNKELGEKVKRAAKADYIPCVIVVDNKTGEVITSRGVDGMQGKPGSDAYPLPSKPELFLSSDDTPCPTDTKTQRAQLIAAMEKEVDASTDVAMLKGEADELQKQAGGVVPADLMGLRAFVKKASKEKIETLTDAQIHLLYARDQEDKNAAEDQQDELEKKYKVGTQIKVLKNFTTDASPDGTIPPYTNVPSLYNGQPNMGSIAAVDMGRDGVPAGLTVYLSDQTAYKRYIAKKNFANIASLNQ